MSSYNSGALEPEDVACLRALAGSTFGGPLELPSGRVMTGEEATALCAALVEESLIQEPEPGDDRLRCGECNQGLRVGDAQLLVHQDGTPICKTPEREAWLSARHLLAVEPFGDRTRRPIPVGVTLIIGCILGLATWGIVYALANSGIFK